MKRSPALVPLSRDHHHALEAARRLRSATDVDVDSAIRHFEAYWEPRGSWHFDIEERLVLVAVPGYGDREWAEAADRVREEHAAIRVGAAALAFSVPEHRLSAAQGLGQLLHDHVRFEERHLFPLLEDRLSEGRLQELGSALAQAGRPVPA
jgi:hypothetical protein